jgi:hypothetical protein
MITGVSKDLKMIVKSNRAEMLETGNLCKAHWRSCDNMFHNTSRNDDLIDSHYLCAGDKLGYCSQQCRELCRAPPYGDGH